MTWQGRVARAGDPALTVVRRVRRWAYLGWKRSAPSMRMTSPLR